ncbi:hypothetical protein B0J17DRAFT_655017 [Rhizoctonia solani]|nr:hypothetical protein B0J17DRAFT_655017 [Rhizoctonia solani]
MKFAGTIVLWCIPIVLLCLITGPVVALPNGPVEAREAKLDLPMPDAFKRQACSVRCPNGLCCPSTRYYCNHIRGEWTCCLRGGSCMVP